MDSDNVLSGLFAVGDSDCNGDDAYAPHRTVIYTGVDRQDWSDKPCVSASTGAAAATSGTLSALRIQEDRSRPNSLTTSDSCTFGVVWGSAAVLCELLCRYADLNKRYILELGAGTGAVGLWVAKRWPSAKVLLTDVQEALPLLQRNVEANGVSANCSVAPLYFGDDPRNIRAFMSGAAGADTRTEAQPLGPPGAMMEPGLVTESAMEQSARSGLGAPHVVLCSDLLFTSMAKPHYWVELAHTLAMAVRGGSEAWICLQERSGSKDITPFFDALRTSFVAARSAASTPGVDDHAGLHELSIVEVLHPVLLAPEPGEVTEEKEPRGGRDDGGDGGDDVASTIAAAEADDCYESPLIKRLFIASIAN